MLGQGYRIESASSEQVQGRKAYRGSGNQNTFIEMNITCVADNVGSTLFANGVLSTYDLSTGKSVPLTEVVHDRLNVEVFRGCTRGCRFCQAGMITRPVRERPADQVRTMVQQGLRRTGYDEVSLTSLSTADFSGIDQLVPTLAPAGCGTAERLQCFDGAALKAKSVLDEARKQAEAEQKPDSEGSLLSWFGFSALADYPELAALRVQGRER